MAVLRANVQGGSGFVGHLSVNDSSKIKIYNGCVYSISIGDFYFDFARRNIYEYFC